MPSMTTDELALAKRLQNDGLTLDRIAREMGTSRNRVWRNLNPDAEAVLRQRRKRQRDAWNRKKARERAIARAAMMPHPPPPGVLWVLNRRLDIVACTLVDLEDWERFKDARLWLRANRYAGLMIDGRSEYLHRQILGLESASEFECDHINRFPLDNRRANLRLVTHRENCANRGGIFLGVDAAAA